MLFLIFDLMSYLTIGLMTIPAWLNFLFEAFKNLGNGFGAE